MSTVFSAAAQPRGEKILRDLLSGGGRYLCLHVEEGRLCVLVSLHVFASPSAVILVWRGFPDVEVLARLERESSPHRQHRDEPMP